MYSTKKLLAGIMAGTMLLSLAACGGAKSPAGSAAGSAAGSVPAEMTEWEKSSNIYATDETEDQLYEKAKEEGTVTIYSISSRIEKVAKAFMEDYPGVTVVPNDISTNELLEKVTREYDAGVHNADVVHIKDQDGQLYNEYVTTKKFYNYKPADIFSHIDEQYTKYATPLYIELSQWFYNTESYPNGSPIDSLWDLTRPEWKGKFVMTNPLDNVGYMSWITGMVSEQTAKELADCYKEEFGSDIQLDSDCPNAGYQFIKNLEANDPMYASSSDAISEAVGTPGQKNAPVGLCASSKLRKAEENGWVMAPIDIKPSTGIPGINTLYVVEGCEHPYAAKLLIRYMMGGTDGTAKGYEPFNTLGGWPVRDDVAPVEGSVDYKTLKVNYFNPEEIYYDSIDVKDFWTKLIQK